MQGFWGFGASKPQNPLLQSLKLLKQFRHIITAEQSGPTNFNFHRLDLFNQTQLAVPSFLSYLFERAFIFVVHPKLNIIFL